MKQLLLGVMQYTQDFDERFPLACHPNNFNSADPHGMQTDPAMPGSFYLTVTGSVNTNYHASLASASSATPDHFATWMDFIFAYIKSSQLFTCPSSPIRTEPSYQYSQCISRLNVGGYVCGGESAATLVTVPVSQAEIVSPSKKVAIAEVNSGILVLGSPYFYGQLATGTSPFTDTYGPRTFQHFDGSNIAYADGHVKWVGKSKWNHLDNAGIGGGTEWDPHID